MCSTAFKSLGGRGWAHPWARRLPRPRVQGSRAGTARRSAARGAGRSRRGARPHLLAADVAVAVQRVEHGAQLGLVPAELVAQQRHRLDELLPLGEGVRGGCACGQGDASATRIRKRRTWAARAARAAAALLLAAGSYGTELTTAGRLQSAPPPSCVALPRSTPQCFSPPRPAWAHVRARDSAAPPVDHAIAVRVHRTEQRVGARLQRRQVAGALPILWGRRGAGRCRGAAGALAHLRLDLGPAAVWARGGQRGEG